MCDLSASAVSSLAFFHHSYVLSHVAVLMAIFCTTIFAYLLWTLGYSCNYEWYLCENFCSRFCVDMFSCPWSIYTQVELVHHAAIYRRHWNELPLCLTLCEVLYWIPGDWWMSQVQNVPSRLRRMIKYMHRKKNQMLAERQRNKGISDTPEQVWSSW